MQITDVQSRSDDGYYAKIDGKECELTGGECAEPGDGPCDICQRRTTEDFGTVVYSDGWHSLCNHCLERNEA